MGALSKLAASVLTYPPQVSACLRLRVDAADGTLACQLSAAGLVQGLGQPTSGLQALLAGDDCSPIDSASVPATEHC